MCLKVLTRVRFNRESNTMLKHNSVCHVALTGGLVRTLLLKEFIAKAGLSQAV